MKLDRQVVLQEANEERYNRKHIDAKIRKEIEANPIMIKRIDHGVNLVNEYRSKDYYASKMKRVAQLENFVIRDLVVDVLIGIAYYQRHELFTSVTAQIASRLKFSDKAEAITTMAELIAVLCRTDAFDIEKANKMASLMLISRIPLSKQLTQFIETSEYLPPMVCEPLEVTHNYASGYLTHNDSLILGSGNHHNGDLCLDVLNTMNRVALKLNTTFLSKLEERPTFALDNQEKAENWNNFKRQSYEFYSLMVQHGNKFYLTHKVDKRGRIYTCGYHINTQGTAFKKASLEFANEELVEGVP